MRDTLGPLFADSISLRCSLAAGGQQRLLGGLPMVLFTLGPGRAAKQTGNLLTAHECQRTV